MIIARLLSERLANASAIDAVSRELEELTETESRLLLDCSAVSLMSSMMLGRMIQLSKRLTSRGGQLVLCCLQPRVFQVFAVAKLTHVFDIQKSRESGLAVLESKGR